jgi:DNA polymerase
MMQIGFGPESYKQSCVEERGRRIKISNIEAQLAIVQPKVVLALGKTATDGLIGHDPKRRLNQMRGTWHEVSGFPMMVTYHPSYLLHNPSRTSKRKVWEDCIMVMEKLRMPVSDKQKAFFL